jgi:hypothetical protein
MNYRDSATLKLAREINDFVRTKTKNATVAAVALEAARATFSLVEWPEVPSVETEPPTQ